MHVAFTYALKQSLEHACKTLTHTCTTHKYKKTHTTTHARTAHTFSTCFRQWGEAAMVLLIISYCYSDSLKHAASVTLLTPSALQSCRLETVFCPLDAHRMVVITPFSSRFKGLPFCQLRSPNLAMATCQHLSGDWCHQVREGPIRIWPLGHNLHAQWKILEHLKMTIS